MNFPIILLRICYWVGAILDLLSGLAMIFTEIFASQFGVEGVAITPIIRTAFFLGGSLMLGWTALLVWADQKPYERKGVIILTVFPVLAGLILSGIYALATGVAAFDKTMPMLILQFILVALFTFSYIFASKTGAKPKRTARKMVNTETNPEDVTY